LHKYKFDSLRAIAIKRQVTTIMTGDDKVGISASGGVTVSGFSGKNKDNEYEVWRDTIVDLIRWKKLKHVLDPLFQLPTRADATTA